MRNVAFAFEFDDEGEAAGGAVEALPYPGWKRSKCPRLCQRTFIYNSAPADGGNLLNFYTNRLN